LKRGVKELRSLLRKYGALDNELRLAAVLEIMENPGISFNDLARKLGVEKGLLAYHIGVLKAAGLVKVNPHRKGRKTSHYQLTEECKSILEELLSKVERPSAQPKPSS